MMFRARLTALVFAAATPAIVSAEVVSSDGYRVPEAGAPVLDCSPRPWLVENVCLLRVPHGADIVEASGEMLSNQRSEDPEVDVYSMGRDADAMAELIVSEEGFENAMFGTLILIDDTPGVSAPARRTTFDFEKQLIKATVDFYQDFGPVAVYSFGDGVRQLMDFSTRSEQDASPVVDELQLTEIQTRLASALDESIDIISSEDFWVKDIVVFSDGAEEGIPRASEVGAYAREKGVQIHTFAMMWETLSRPSVSQQNDYMSIMARESGGVHTQVNLRDPEAAEAALTEATDRVVESRFNTRLIQVGDLPADFRLTVTLAEPVSRAEGAGTVENEYSVVLTANTTADSVEAEDAAENNDGAQDETETEGDGKILGLDRNTFLIALAAGLSLVLITILALFAFLGSRRKNHHAANAGPVPQNYDRTQMVPQQSAAQAPRTRAAPPPPPAPAFGKLVMADGASFVLRGSRALVGRSHDCDVQINDKSVTRHHASIQADGASRIVLSDLGSLNGTFVNGRRVSAETFLENGSKLRFGTTEAVFRKV